MTNRVLETTGADKGVAFAAYGLLAASIFTGGLTGVAAVILAYVSRGQVSEAMRRHLTGVIRLFWTMLLLFLVSVFCAAVASVLEVEAAHAQVPVAKALAFKLGGFRFDGVPLAPGVVPFALASVLAGLGGGLLSLVGPAFGVIRLATTDG